MKYLIDQVILITRLIIKKNQTMLYKQNLVFSFPLSTRVLNAVFVLGMFALIVGCDSTGVNTHHKAESPKESTNSTTSLPEMVQYVYGHFENGEPHTVRVILDPGLAQERRSFESFDDYYDELDTLMDQEELVVNASLYHRLIHALYPSEIRLLDTAGDVVIEGYLYSSTKEASYRRPLGASIDAQELEEYWGEDGKAVEQELSTLHRYMDQPESLAKFSFRNPLIKSEVESIKSGIASKAPPDNASHVTRRTEDGYTVCLPSARSREAGITPHCYSVEFLLWNQSTTTRKRRAIAGIEVFVVLPGGRKVTSDRGPLGLGSRIRLKVTSIGGRTQRTAECYGDLRIGDLNKSYNPPYDFVRVERSCDHITVVANRKGGRGAASKNSGGFEEYFTPTVLENGRTYLVFSNRGSWKFEEEYLN